VSDPNNDDDDEKGLSCFIASSILDKILGNEKKGIKSRSQVNNNDENNNQIAVLINNLGGTSELEMSVFAKDVMNNLLKRNLKPVRCYIGSFMTSLEMAGVSVSILPADWMTLSALDSPTNAPGWKKSYIKNTPELDLSSRILPKDTSSSSSLHVTTSGGGECPEVNSILITICEAIISAEQLLTEYDSKCGDGDCGQTMKSSAQHILKKASSSSSESFSTHDCALFCSELAQAISESMGGTSGALYEIMFRSMAQYFHGKPSQGVATIQIWALALEVGSKSIMNYGGATEGMRTMLDALIPATQAMVSATSSSLTTQEVINQASSAALEGAERTKTMASLAGRANYVAAAAMEGIPDPGAYAIYVALKAISSNQ
jgi:dihydroxyacetone kinase